VIEMIKGTKLDDMEQIEHVQQWNNRVNKLVNSIETLLDPIDIAFYQPHLKQCVQKAYKRTTLLLGSLVQFNKIYSNVRQKSSLQEQHNVLVLTPLVSRFSLLPISSPSRLSTHSEENNNPSIQRWTPPDSDNNTLERPQSQSFVDRLGSFLW